MSFTPPIDYLPLVHAAQRIVAQDLLDLSKQAGLLMDSDGRTRLSRLAQADIYETLLVRVAQQFANAPECPVRLESAFKQFVLKHLQAALLTWLAHATQHVGDEQVLSAALQKLGMPFPLP